MLLSGQRSPIAQLVAPALSGPNVALLDHEPAFVEPEEGRSCERLDSAVSRGHHGPPVDRGTIAGDYGLAETTLRVGLIRECPDDVITWSLRRSKRM